MVNIITNQYYSIYYILTKYLYMWLHIGMKKLYLLSSHIMICYFEE